MLGVCLFAVVAMWSCVLARVNAVSGLCVVGVVMCLGAGDWAAVVLLRISNAFYMLEGTINIEL